MNKNSWRQFLGLAPRIAQPTHNDRPVAVDGLDVTTAGLDDLNLANIELGRQIDQLRDKRKALKVEIDRRHVQRNLKRGG